jgi:hypothetical protein
VVGGDGWPIGEGVDVGEVFGLGGAAATRPTVVALGSLTVGRERVPPGELWERDRLSIERRDCFIRAATRDNGHGPAGTTRDTG